jgi:hypothetical protein
LFYKYWIEIWDILVFLLQFHILKTVTVTLRLQLHGAESMFISWGEVR